MKIDVYILFSVLSENRNNDRYTGPQLCSVRAMCIYEALHVTARCTNKCSVTRVFGAWGLKQ